MPRRRLMILILAVVFLGLADFILTLYRSMRRHTEVSLHSVSPDGRSRIDLREIVGFMHIDRNFEIRLNETQTLFESPDEGPAGTERIIWSRDSSSFVLIGKRFSAPPLSNGESLYLLYDVTTGSIHCNSHQQRKYPTFTRADLDKIQWSEDLPLGF